MAHGVRFGLLTVFGTASAMVLHLGLTILGLATLQAVFAAWFDVLRWFGVVYLLHLAWRAWHAAPADLSRTSAQPRSSRRVFLRGFLVSLTNPKTLFFYGAFLPQFIIPRADPLPQSILLAATLLAVAVILDSGWAVLAGRCRTWLLARSVWRNRLTGGLLAGAGVGLALARRS